MTLIVEDGTGIYEANSYTGPGFVRSYLASRNRASDWISATRDAQNASLIAATEYIDKRFGARFLGSKEFTQLSVFASNILTFYTNAQDGEQVTIGTVTYTFRTVAVVANDVQIGATISDTLDALVAAIAGAAGGNGTVAHPTASGTALSASSAVLVRALVAGPLASAIETSSNSLNISWDLPALTGGQDLVSQQLEFPRRNLYDKNGNLVIGIPLALKQSVAEYASRAVTQILIPDPVVDPTGQSVAEVVEKVGPIETRTRYSLSSAKDIFQRFPAADKLLLPFLSPSNQVFR